MADEQKRRKINDEEDLKKYHLKTAPFLFTEKQLIKLPDMSVLKDEYIVRLLIGSSMDVIKDKERKDLYLWKPNDTKWILMRDTTLSQYFNRIKEDYITNYFAPAIEAEETEIGLLLEKNTEAATKEADSRYTNLMTNKAYLSHLNNPIKIRTYKYMFYDEIEVPITFNPFGKNSRSNWNTFPGFKARYIPIEEVYQEYGCKRYCDIPSIATILKHIWEVNSGDENYTEAERLDNFNFIINFFAWPIVKKEKTNVLLYLLGEKQIGKSIIIEELLHNLVYGKDIFLSVPTIDTLTDNFNSLLVGKILINIDEAEKAGDYKYQSRCESIIKTLVHGKFVVINEKYVKQKEGDNYFSIIICTNNNNVIPRLQKFGAEKAYVIRNSERYRDKKKHLGYFTHLASLVQDQHVGDLFYSYLKSNEYTRLDTLRQNIEQLPRGNREMVNNQAAPLHKLLSEEGETILPGTLLSTLTGFVVVDIRDIYACSIKEQGNCRSTFIAKTDLTRTVKEILKLSPQMNYNGKKQFPTSEKKCFLSKFKVNNVSVNDIVSYGTMLPVPIATFIIKNGEILSHEPGLKVFIMDAGFSKVESFKELVFVNGKFEEKVHLKPKFEEGQIIAYPYLRFLDWAKGTSIDIRDQTNTDKYKIDMQGYPSHFKIVLDEEITNRNSAYLDESMNTNQIVPETQESLARLNQLNVPRTLAITKGEQFIRDFLEQTK